MGRHRLEGRWSHISTANVLVFPDGDVGRVDGTVIGNVGYRLVVGEPWVEGEQ